MRKFQEWLPVLTSFYPAINKRTPTLVYGSQILAVVQGLDVASKDVDLLSPGVTLTAIEEAYQESSGEEEMRMELLKTKKGHVFTIYYPIDENPIPVEIFTTTFLGDPLPTFEGHIIEVMRWGIRFLSLSVEAYAVLEAARGLRPVSIERFRRAVVDWESAEDLARRLGLEEKLRELEEIVRR